MRRLLLTYICLIPLSPVAQDVNHARTLESCVSRINVWLSEAIPGSGMKTVPNSVYKPDAFKQLTYVELRFRTAFLGECIAEHSELAVRTDETRMGVEVLPTGYEVEMKQRLESFLARHGFTQDFIEEDLAGKR